MATARSSSTTLGAPLADALSLTCRVVVVLVKFSAGRSGCVVLLLVSVVGVGVSTAALRAVFSEMAAVWCLARRTTSLGSERRV